MARDDIIRASELNSYAYCERAWWLKRVKGYKSGNLKDMERGTLAHREHGHVVARSVEWRRWAFAFLGLAVLSGMLFVWQLIAI